MSKTESLRVYKFSEEATQSRRDNAIAVLRKAGYMSSRCGDFLTTAATLGQIHSSIGTSADIEREIKNFKAMEVGFVKGISAEDCGIRIKSQRHEVLASAAAFGIDPATLQADLNSTAFLGALPCVSISRQRESVTEQRERIKDMIRHFAKGLEEDKADAELQALCAWVYNLRKGAEAK